MRDVTSVTILTVSILGVTWAAGDNGAYFIGLMLAVVAAVLASICHELHLLRTGGKNETAEAGAAPAPPLNPPKDEA